MRLAGALRSVVDAVHLFGVDWITPTRRLFWHQARAGIRTQKFRAHAEIPAVDLATLIGKFANGTHDVILPSARTERGGVGDASYYYILGALAQAARPMSVVEIGTYLGVGTLTLALNTPAEAKIYTVDLPDDVHNVEAMNPHATDRYLVHRSRRHVGEAFATHSVRSKIIQVRADSTRLNLRDYVTEADFVLIDGGHSFDLIKKDTENALAVLGKRGVIIWDDYWWFYPEVVRYLDGLANKLPLFCIEDSNLVVHLPVGRKFSL